MRILKYLYDFSLQWAKGYTKSHLRVGLQTFISFIAVSAILAPYPIWNALYYATVVPTIVLVVMAQVCPAHVGGATLGAIYLVGSFIIGGLLAAGATYSAYAANGYSFASSVTKVKQAL